jgi:NAD(P)H-hydrate repair Nnr-like enzyme with NAD(P)H-hydrate dehydratase domain
MKALTNSNNSNNTSAAADTQPAAVTPEQIVEQLHALRLSMPQAATLTRHQKVQLRGGLTASEAVVQAQVNVIAALENANVQFGQPAADVRQIGEESNRWTEVIDELKAMLAEAEGANLVRQQKLHRLASQGYGVAVSLARDPEYSVLVPHVLEVKRLRKATAKKKRGAETPAHPMQ